MPVLTAACFWNLTLDPGVISFFKTTGLKPKPASIQYTPNARPVAKKPSPQATMLVSRRFTIPSFPERCKIKTPTSHSVR